MNNVLEKLPTLNVLSRGRGVIGAVSPWSNRLLKPDAVFEVNEDLAVVLEADDDDGHSRSRGNNITRFGGPWQYSRDLNAEMAKMKSVARALSASHPQVLFIRCNSDNKSIRIGDIGCLKRAHMVACKIREISSSSNQWKADCFRLCLVDMPSSRSQDGFAIDGTDDVWIPLDHE